MGRRGFFRAAVAAIAGLAGVGEATAAAATSDLRAVHKYDRVNDRWVRCRMYHLKPGDEYWLEDVGVFRACTYPTKGPDGVWEICSDYRIDPATNEWVPCPEKG